MRMTPAEGSTAADLVNRLSEPELAEVFRRYGEERQAGRIARAVARSRCEAAITTTDRLAAVVAAAVGGRRGRLHPATRVFQALRMAVNGELNSLDRALEGGLSVLRPGGRLAVIAFESLTDRVVKRCFVAHAGRWVSLAAGGRGWEGRHPKVRLLTRKPVRPGPDEVRANARARSARLRAVERLSEEEANADSKCPDGGHGRG
jgi:16S rRNA (cytosine1402-N4)-methyltransferase